MHSLHFWEAMAWVLVCDGNGTKTPRIWNTWVFFWYKNAFWHVGSEDPHVTSRRTICFKPRHSYGQWMYQGQSNLESGIQTCFCLLVIQNLIYHSFSSRILLHFRQICQVGLYTASDMPSNNHSKEFPVHWEPPERHRDLTLISTIKILSSSFWRCHEVVRSKFEVPTHFQGEQRLHSKHLG